MLRHFRGADALRSPIEAWIEYGSAAVLLGRLKATFTGHYLSARDNFNAMALEQGLLGEYRSRTGRVAGRNP